MRNNEDLLQSFKEQAANSASKVTSRFKCCQMNSTTASPAAIVMKPHTASTPMTCFCTSGMWVTVVSVGVSRGAELVPAADGGGEEELWDRAAEEEGQGYIQRYIVMYLHWTSIHFLCFSRAQCSAWSSPSSSPGVLSAGEAPQHHPGLSELQRAEPAASALSPAAADHADGEHHPNHRAGGEPEHTADTGRLEVLRDWDNNWIYISSL